MHVIATYIFFGVFCLFCFCFCFFSEFSQGSAVGIAVSVLSVIVIILPVGGSIIVIYCKRRNQGDKKTESELSKRGEFPSVSAEHQDIYYM